MRKVATEAALAFIGVDGSRESIEAFYSREKTPVSQLAESIGVIISEDVNEERYIQEMNGKTYLNPGMDLNSEFDAALSVGAFLIYGSTPVELTSDEHKVVSLFAVTVIAPGLSDEIAEEPTLGELIEFSRTTKIPFNALKNAFD